MPLFPQYASVVLLALTKSRYLGPSWAIASLALVLTASPRLSTKSNYNDMSSQVSRPLIPQNLSSEYLVRTDPCYRIPGLACPPNHGTDSPRGHQWTWILILTQTKDISITKTIVPTTLKIVLYFIPTTTHLSSRILKDLRIGGTLQCQD